MRLVYISLVLCASVSHLVAEAGDQPRDETEVRERRGDIPTIYNDIRSPMATVMPGVDMTDDVSIDVLFQSAHRYYTEAVPNQVDTGRQQEVDLRLRMRCYYQWLTFEVTPAAIQSPYADTYDLENMDTDLAFSLWQDRYRGGQLALGAALPLGQGKIIGDTASSKYFHPAYFAELRVTEHVLMNVFHVNLGGRFGPNVYNKLAQPLDLTNGEEIPGQVSVTSNYLRLEARLGWTYRPCIYSRLGAFATGRLDHSRFTGDNGGSTIKSYQFLAEAFYELDPCQGLALQATLGVQPNQYHDDHHGSLVGGGDLQCRF